MNTLPNNGPFPDVNRRDSRGLGEDRGPGEDTLRLIASLPAPEGLTGRVKEGLRTAPEPGKILMWRGPLIPSSGWLYSVARGAAAAAIVCIVAGGGWGVYSHVRPVPSANVIVLPTPGTVPGSGFSSSKATRVPETLDGPLLTHHVAPAPEVNAVQKMPGQAKAVPGGAAMRKKKAARAVTVPVQ